MHLQPDFIKASTDLFVVLAFFKKDEWCIIASQFFYFYLFEQKYPNRLTYDKNVLQYLNKYEEVRNTLPKIIANIFDKLGGVKLKFL